MADRASKPVWERLFSHSLMGMCEPQASIEKHRALPHAFGKPARQHPERAVELLRLGPRCPPPTSRPSFVVRMTGIALGCTARDLRFGSVVREAWRSSLTSPTLTLRVLVQRRPPRYHQLMTIVWGGSGDLLVARGHRRYTSGLAGGDPTVTGVCPKERGLSPMSDAAAEVTDHLAGLSRLAEGDQLALVGQLLAMATIAAREVIEASRGGMVRSGLARSDEAPNLSGQPGIELRRRPRVTRARSREEGQRFP